MDCLRLDVLSVNDTLGAEGLPPILLAFRVIPRGARVVRSTNQLKRARNIDAAMIEVEGEQGRRRKYFCLKHLGGPT